MRKGNRKWNLLDRVVYGIFGIAIGLIFCVFQLDINLFIKNGVETTAIVIDSYCTDGKYKTYYLYVEYNVNGEKYKAEIDTSGKTYEKLKDGGTIMIYYNPTNPSEADCIDGYGKSYYIFGAIFIFAGVACFFIKE